MSSLQLGLIVAGILLVVGVIIYNGWQEHRLKRRLASASRKDPTQVIATPPGAGRREPTLSEVEQASTVPSPSAIARAPVEPPAEPFAIPMDVLPSAPSSEVSTEPASEQGLDAIEPSDEEAELATVEHVRPGARPDPDIECMIALQPTRPVAAPALAAGLHARLGKPLRWFGRSGNGPWQLLSKDTPGTFTELAACLLLADRNGPVSRGQLDAFLRVASEIAPSLPAAFLAPDLDEELERSEALDRLCAEVDVQVGLTVMKAEPSSIPGTRLRGVAEAAGFRLAPSGRFDFINEDNGAVLYSLQNARNEPFTAESLRVTSVNGVVLLLDVPRVADPMRVFDQMKLAAKRLAVTLGAEVVDDNRRVLDDAALARTREQVEDAANALREVHIEPGSARALALFNA
ncbi:MAG TPA: cell division protein ZipA C-terminal FtsZ-binding domain-containing protein, partial [Casimicrobiaceae bacterium]|nr:cell division protein ZipA C-terminal FtsZ-binding domain-containing protein [Casimicrobiaceae bacterium]